MYEHDEHTSGDEDGLGCARALTLAIPVGLVAWGLALWLTMCQEDLQNIPPRQPGPTWLNTAA